MGGVSDRPCSKRDLGGGGVYCNPFGRPASPKRRMRDPGKEFVNDILIASFFHLQVVHVCSFVCSLVVSFVRSMVRVVVPSFLWFVRLFVRLAVCSLVRSCARLFDLSSNLSFVRSFVRLFVISVACSFIRLFVGLSLLLRLIFYYVVGYRCEHSSA